MEIWFAPGPGTAMTLVGGGNPTSLGESEGSSQAASDMSAAPSNTPCWTRFMSGHQSSRKPARPGRAAVSQSEWRQEGRQNDGGRRPGSYQHTPGNHARAVRPFDYLVGDFVGVTPES